MTCVVGPSVCSICHLRRISVRAPVSTKRERSLRKRTTSTNSSLARCVMSCKGVDQRGWLAGFGGCWPWPASSCAICAHNQEDNTGKPSVKVPYIPYIYMGNRPIDGRIVHQGQRAGASTTPRSKASCSDVIGGGPSCGKKGHASHSFSRKRHLRFQNRLPPNGRGDGLKVPRRATPLGLSETFEQWCFACWPEGARLRSTQVFC